MNLSIAHLLYANPSKDLSEKDYYPGGMVMPERSFSYENYGFGFNGKLKDDEVKGSGNSYDYGMRIFDPRLVRFLSVDPLSSQFPWWSPYQFAGNSTIRFVDLDGLEIGMTLPWWEVLRPVLTIPKVEIPPPPSMPIPPMIPETIGIPDIPISPTQPSIPTTWHSQSIDWSNAPPSSPNDLSPDWDETTNPDNKSGKKEFTNKKTGERIRWDPGEPGKEGYRGKNGWHRYNPEWTKKWGKKDYYLDKDGNPVNRGSGPSHIFPSSSGNTLPVIIVWPDSDKEWQHYYDQKDKWDDNFKKWIKNHKRELKDYFDQKSKETKTS